MGSGAITLFHIRGIRVGVDYSWFVILFLIIFWLSGSYRDALGESTDAFGPYALAVASALLFFGSILLHELGHAVVAIRNGIGIGGITLWMFGGIARLERDSDTPSTEFKIAIAGPAVTAAIVVVCTGLGLALAGPEDFLDAALTNSATGTSGVAAMVAWLASINMLVLLFNLLPAFPLDGGRVTRAIAWWRTGSRASATRFAATLGQWIGYGLIAIGLIYFFGYLGDLIGGVWLALVGFIITGSAKGAVEQSRVEDRLDGISVRDVMDRQPVAIPERLTIEQAQDEFFLRYRYPWFPVIDGSSRFVGLLDQGTADSIAADERSTKTVEEVLARDAGSLTILDTDPLEAVLGNESLRRLGALMAVDGEGRLSGVLTTEAVGRALRDPVTESPIP